LVELDGSNSKIVTGVEPFTRVLGEARFRWDKCVCHRRPLEEITSD